MRSHISAILLFLSQSAATYSVFVWFGLAIGSSTIRLIRWIRASSSATRSTPTAPPVSTIASRGKVRT